ncbi:hypothetical protein MUO14_19775 [Halobacillus shinanisalinarum]|uniref:Uncharacterized protein n=1 Tax=Halobacillus shinanisalinarum TaxID=2932258 RepID=A0ABY4GZ14_9BACI|nr:hypothetical protein [Halobacillus shinanisalinarum]UOQ92642.1 hypothetical protein MUO14_19775 [Halobacillus shinanisalinarum]
MINLVLGVVMLFIVGLYLGSYIFDPNNALVVSLSKKQFIILLIVFTLITVYLLGTGIYHSFLK